MVVVGSGHGPTLENDRRRAVYPVLNRANAGIGRFEKPEDDHAFERILEQAAERVAMPGLAYCLMPNHWHWVLWPPGCQRAEQWRWSSLWRWVCGDDAARKLLAAWPVARPRDWVAWVNRVETEKELEALRRCARRGQPFGSEPWAKRITRRFGLESLFRPRGRPKRHQNGS